MLGLTTFKKRSHGVGRMPGGENFIRVATQTETPLGANDDRAYVLQEHGTVSPNNIYLS